MRSLFVALLLPFPLLAAPPVFQTLNPQTVNENQDITIPVNATDADGDTITLSAAGLPTNAIFSDTGNGSGFIQFAPDFTQAGVFDVTVTATAAAESAQLVVEITVVNVNRAPIINGQASITGTVGDLLTANFGALDPDGDTVTFSGENLPGDMTVTNNGNNSATITFTPTENEAGRFNIAINADDGTQISAIPVLVDIEPLPAEGCSVDPASRSTTTASLLLLLLGALLACPVRGRSQR